MTADFVCPACGRELRVNSSGARTQIPCTGCGIILTAIQTARGICLQLPPGSRAREQTGPELVTNPTVKQSSASESLAPAASAATPVTPSVRSGRSSTLKGTSRRGAVGGGMIFVGIVAFVFWWTFARDPSLPQVVESSESIRLSGDKHPEANTPPIEVKKATEESDTTAPRALSNRELIRLAEPAVCRIRTPSGVGSGFIAGPHLICTNEHVLGLNDESSWMVEFPAREGRRFGRITLAFAPNDVDLVLLHVERLPADYKPLAVVTRNQLQKGDRLVVIGSPGGMQNVVTEGIVGSFQELNRQMYIQLSVSVNPGNSGGPAINEFGEVAGVVTLKAEEEGIGMAIPGDVVTQALKDLARLSPTEGIQVRTRWRARQTGTKLVQGGREGVEILRIPSDTAAGMKYRETWKQCYGDSPEMSRNLRNDALEPEKHPLFVRLEQLFDDIKTAVMQSGTDAAERQRQCELFTVRINAIEEEVKDNYGLADTDRVKKVHVGEVK